MRSEDTVDRAYGLQRDLTEQMCDVPGLDAPEGRDLLISMLADQLPGLANIRRHPRMRHDLLEVVRACLHDPRGASVLVTTLGDFAPGARAVRRVSGLVDASQVLSSFPVAELREVHTLLKPARHLDVSSLLYAAVGGMLPEPEQPVASLADAFDLLTELNARADGLLPALALVEHIAAKITGAPAEALRGWNDAQARGLDLLVPLLALRADLTAGAAAEPAPACLVVQLQKHGISSDRYVLSHWRQLRPGAWQPIRGEDTSVALSDVRAALERLIGQIETDWGSRPGKPVLEFVLPFNLLNQPFEWLTLTADSSSTALCLSYPVVFRSLERMRATKYHRRWRNRWQIMLKEPSIRCHWESTGRGHDPVRWINALAADERLSSVALSAPPSRGPAADGGTPLEAALQAGVPLAVWDRRPTQTGEFRRQVRKLMKGTPTGLPERVQELRQEAATAGAARRDSHAGRHLAVLWDDPNRLVDCAPDGALVPVAPGGTVVRPADERAS